MRNNHSTVISIWNLKGGVGKSVISIHLAYLLASKGYRTLLLDFDEQANTSFFFERSLRKSTKPTLQEVLDDPKKLYQSTYSTQYPNLYFLRNGNQRIERTKTWNQLEGLMIQSQAYKRSFDFILIDLHPDAELGSCMALEASDQVLVPILLDGFCRDNLSLVSDCIQLIEAGRGKKLPWYCIANRVKQNKNQLSILEDLVLHHEYPMLNNCIRECSAIPYALNVKKPVLKCRSKSKASQDFHLLYDELFRELEEM